MSWWHKHDLVQAIEKSEKREKAQYLAGSAGCLYDEHGHSRGDYRFTVGMDFIPPDQAEKPPFFCFSGEGLGLVRILRKRVYAKSCQWFPQITFAHYLVGKNEDGTHFEHPVARTCETVEEAIAWIWQNKEKKILFRQGDIALITGRASKGICLPEKHRVSGNLIIHPTHPPIPFPGKNQKIIIARRARDYIGDSYGD